MQSTFTINTKEIKAALIAMNRIGSKFTKASMLKITVLTDKIEIATQGITKILKAETDGLADISVPALLIKGYVSTSSSATMQFTFKQGELKCGSSLFSSPFIRIETVFNIPENDLPINATRMSVLRFEANKSKEEIERLNLGPSITYANRTLRDKIHKALEYLDDYEVTFNDLHELIQKKIKN